MLGPVATFSLLVIVFFVAIGLGSLANYCMDKRNDDI